MKWISNVVNRATTFFKPTQCAPQSLLESKHGVVVGRSPSGHLLVDSTPEPVMLFACVRSGQQIGVMIPTLLSWPQSVVTIDIKGEAYQITARYRSTLGGVGYFNPTSRSSMKWNPLQEIRSLEDVYHLVEALLPRQEDEGTAYVFARDILMATVCYVLEANNTLGSVSRLLDDPIVWLDTLRKTPKSSVYDDLIGQVLERIDDVNEGFNIARHAVRLWRDPIVDHVTSSSDFFIEDLRAEVLSFYFVLPPADLHRLCVLVRVFLSQMSRVFETSAEHRLLVLCDEAPLWGRLSDVVSTTIASQSVKWVMFAQCVAHCRGGHESDDALLNLCQTILARGCNDNETATYLSQKAHELGCVDWDAERFIMLDQQHLVILQDELTQAHYVTYFNDPCFTPKVHRVEFP